MSLPLLYSYPEDKGGTSFPGPEPFSRHSLACMKKLSARNVRIRSLSGSLEAPLRRESLYSYFFQQVMSSASVPVSHTLKTQLCC